MNLAHPPKWSERAASSKPIAARQDFEAFEAVSTRPANDHADKAAYGSRVSPDFLGSRYFWTALGSTVVFCALFAVLMGFGSGAAIGALVRAPGQYSPFLLSMLVIGALQWFIAMAAHRQAVVQEMWRRMMSVSMSASHQQRHQDYSPKAEEANWKLNQTFDRLLSDLDARMALLDEKTTVLSSQIAAAMHQSTESADLNISQMRNILEATEIQREALQRSGVMISTEILPVVSKLEGTVQVLEGLSQSAGGILGTVSSQLQQSTRDLQTCLDDFSRTNQTVSPEIEKRLLRFESTITRLPEQLEAGLNRLTPLSDTIADAAMLSTANIGVIEELGKDIAANLQKSRTYFNDFALASKHMLKEQTDAHLNDFRDHLGAVIKDETVRLSVMSREIGYLADTASSVVDKLQQPVNQVSAQAEKTLADMQQQVSGLEEKIQEHLRLSVSQLNDAAAQVVRTVSREIEAAAIGLQTRLATSSNDLVQRVNFDTTRFETLIADVGEKTSNRVSSALKDLPAALSHRIEQEIAKVDGLLKTSVTGLSDQMRTVIDTIPNRLAAMTHDTIKLLETDLDRSFEGVAQRSERLNEKFKQNAAETTDAVIASYVDFIFLAVERFRTEMEGLNDKFSKNLELTMKPAPEKIEVLEPAAE